MENAVDALKMAGSVLLFVVGLATAILAFSQAKVAIDAVLAFSDRDSATIQLSESDLESTEISEEKKNYYKNIFNYVADSTKNSRNVGLDTMIPTIYRKFDERYKIVFIFPDNYYLYKNTEGKEMTEISDVGMSGGVVNAKKEFLDAILYRKFRTNKNNFIYNDFPGVVSELSDTGLFDKLRTYLNNGRQITEYLGMYDQNDIKKDDSTSHEKSEANEKIQRVIVYDIH